MNRTQDFFTEVHEVRKKRQIQTKTEDLIRPTIRISPFLKDANQIYMKMKMTCQYITTFSKQWKSNKVKLSETSESEFESFENDMESLLNTIEKEIDSLKEKKYDIIVAFTTEVQEDLKDLYIETKQLFHSVVETHSSYQRFASILKPSISSSLQMKDIIKQPQPSYEKESSSLLNSLSSEERDRLLSENVQIERSLEREIDAVKKIERNTRELTQLISTFNQQVAEQHEMVDTIHDNTITAKEQVDEGYKHLLSAEENSKGTRLKLAYLIFFLTFLLLIYNWFK